MLELCICELHLSLLCVCWTAVAHPPVSCFHTCFKHASVRALLANWHALDSSWILEMASFALVITFNFGQIHVFDTFETDLKRNISPRLLSCIKDDVVCFRFIWLVFFCHFCLTPFVHVWLLISFFSELESSC